MNYPGDRNTQNNYSRARRAAGAVLLSVVLLLVMVGGPASAQTSRKLKIGDKVNGIFDARTFAQSYSFDATKGSTLTIAALSNTRGLLLALLLTDASGTPLQQVAELTKPTVEIVDFKPETGTYYLTVFRATGVQGNTQSSFTLSLTGTATTAPAGGSSATTQPAVAVQTIDLLQGMSIALTWTTTDDLNLEVRDSIGGAANLNNPAATSGGRYGGNVNGNCPTATATNPTERVDWTKGSVPVGSYEIIVYYVKSCAQTAAPNAFTVQVTVDGRALEPIRGTLDRDNQNYVSSIIIDTKDQILVRAGGPNISIDPNPFATKIAAPTQLVNNAAAGRIDRNNAADVYQIAVNQGESFAIDLSAINGGSLDPFLVLLGPTNAIVAENDDANQTTRNSRLEIRTAAAGTYKIIASRFALANGGTEGNYSLTITRGTGSEIVAPIQPTAAPGQPGANATAQVGGPVAVIPTLAAGGSLGVITPGSIEVSLNWNSRADLRLLIRDPRGASLFSDRPRIDSGGILAVQGNFNCNASVSITPVTYAYWPQTVRLLPGTYEIQVFRKSLCDDIDPAFNLKVTVGGKQVLTVDSSAPTDTVKFLTTFTIGADGTAVKGPFGFFDNTLTTDIGAALPTAKEVIPNQSPALEGEITDKSFYQVYFFKGQIGDKITVSMKRNAGNTLDPYLFLFQPDGKTLVAFNDDNSAAVAAPGGPLAPPDSQIKEYTLTKDGNYVIVATRFGVDLGGTTGKYRLTVNR